MELDRYCSMSIELNRILWRYKAHYYHQSRLISSFRDEIGRLTTEFAGYEKEIDVLRALSPTLLHDFDEATSEALISLEETRYEDSLRQIKRAQASIRELRSVLEVASACRLVEKAHAEFNSLIQAERLKQLPTPRILSRLVSEFNRLLEEREYQQAVFVARMCQNDIDELQKIEQGNPEKSIKLSVRIDEIVDICKWAENLVLSLKLDIHGDGAADALRSLINNGQLRLAEQLLEELELELADSKAFWTEYERRSSIHENSAEYSMALTAELRQMISHESWDAATQRLLRSNLENTSSELQSLNSRIPEIIADTKPHSSKKGKSDGESD